MQKNIYKPIKAKLEKIIDETSNIKTFVLKPEEKFSFATGQFVELDLPGFGEAPFTPSSSPLDTKSLEITIMKTGRVTSKLHQLQGNGEVVGIRGPYGKGYPLENMYGKELLILGGGVGLAPLRSLIYALLAQKDKFKKIILCYGARTPQDIVYKDLLKEWKKTKELEIHQSIDKPADGWSDTVGVVTVLLKNLKVDVKNSCAIVCGPPIMMKFGTLELLKMKYPEDQIYLSMEKNMSCGFGKCGHCQMGKYFVCKDGPVFTYDMIKDVYNMWD
ncbi:MAG: FAD/NAD(P)-binding protein [bacterium]